MKTGDSLQVIKIDPEGKQLLIVKYPENYPVRIEGIERIGRAITGWLKTDDPVFILPVVGDIEVRLERVDDA